MLANLGRGGQALDVLRKSVASSPDGRPLSLLGLLAEEQDEWDLAIQPLRKPITLEPRNEDRYLDLSLLFAKRGNFELGDEILRIVLSELPESYRLHIQLGAVLERAAKRDDAERVFRKAIAIHEEHQLAIASLGSLQLFADRVEAALATLENGVVAFPDDFYPRKGGNPGGRAQAATRCRPRVFQCLERGMAALPVTAAPGVFPPRSWLFCLRIVARFRRKLLMREHGVVIETLVRGGLARCGEH